MVKTVQAHKPVGETVEWLTPPEIIQELGPFDLDPCTPINRPWDTASVHYNRLDDGLSKEWFGRIWVNPPYSAKDCDIWMERFHKHGNGMALVFARTETKWFCKWGWTSDLLLFPEGRLYFYKPDGTRASGNAGHGSVILAMGDECVDKLYNSSIKGARVKLS